MNLSLFLLDQERVLNDILKKHSPCETVRKLLDNHFINLYNVVERWSDSGATPAAASLSGTPGPSSSYGSVPHTPATAFSNDTVSVSSSKFPVSRARSSSATSIARRGFGTCPVPLENFHLDSSSVNSSVAYTALAFGNPVLGDLTNNARSQRPPIMSPDRQEKSWTDKIEKEVEDSHRPREEQRLFSKTVSHATQNEQTSSKRRKVGRSDVPDEDASMFVSPCGAEDSSEEEDLTFMTWEKFGDVDARKRAKSIIQEPKIKKAGHARRRSIMSTSDADEQKIILDFTAWEQDELIRKRGIGALNPKAMYRRLKGSIDSDGDRDEESNYTASQVALMILSLGSTQAIVDLKAIIKGMRCASQAILVRPPAKFAKKLNKVLELVRWVFNSTDKGTPLENFQSRYCITNFCKYMVEMRDKVMLEKGVMKTKDADRLIYANLIVRAYPKILRYAKDQTGANKKETPQFKNAVTELQTKAQRGFRWLALRQKFGVGVMALYYHGKLFSDTARVSIDDEDVSEEEFNLLLNYLSKNGNTHSAWLSRLCNLIKAHIEQGAEGMLRLPELFLEKWAVDQIMKCQEQSNWLSMMCETLDDRLRYPGNKVTQDAWLSVDRQTLYADWQKEVEKEAEKGEHKEVQGEVQF
jgi:hypothetical protein